MMLLRILILLIILLVAPAVWCYLAYVRHWTRTWWKRALVALPSVFLLVYMLCVLRRDDMSEGSQVAVGLFMFLFLLLTLPPMLFTILDFTGWLVSKMLGTVHRPLGERDGLLRRGFRIAAMAVALCSAFILCYGYLEGRRHYVVHQQTFFFSNLPKQFDGYRILQFSDLHLGTFADGHQKDVSEIAELINAQKCDAIMFTGDLVNYQTRESDAYTEVLSRLNAPDGVFSILGNHDYSMYRRVEEAEREADIRALKQRERSYGWHLLLNQHALIKRNGASIAVVGSENDGRPPFPSKGDLTKAMKGLPADMFCILLTHDPTHWRREVIPNTDIDLTLSGHTHAGQFKVFGWSPVAWVYDEWSGAYSEGEQILNVSDGVGQVMFPFRFGAWPEINVIELRVKSEE